MFSSATCQNQAGADSARISETVKRMPCQVAGQRQPLAVAPHLGRTARAEQGDGLDRLPEPAEIEVRRPALHLVAEEQVEHDVLVVHTADRAVGIHLHDQAGGTFEADGILVGLAVFIRHGVTPDGSMTLRHSSAYIPEECMWLNEKDR